MARGTNSSRVSGDEDFREHDEFGAGPRGLACQGAGLFDGRGDIEENWSRLHRSGFERLECHGFGLRQTRRGW